MPDNAFLQILDSNMPVITRNFDYNYLILSIIAFVVFVLLIISNLIAQNYFKNLIITAIRFEALQKIKQESGLSVFISFLTTSISGLNIAASIMMIISYYKFQLFNITNSLVLISILIIAVLFYFIFFKTNLILLGNLTLHKSYATNYGLIKFNNIKALSIFLLPLFLLFPFVGEKTQQSLVIIAFSILLLMLIINIISFFIYLIKIKFFNHYSILYFCTLEILPLLIVFKLIGMW